MSGTRRLQATIKRRRELLGYTVAEAAKLADVSGPTWSRWETGGRTPSLHRLECIAKALKVKPEELL